MNLKHLQRTLKARVRLPARTAKSSPRATLQTKIAWLVFCLSGSVALVIFIAPQLRLTSVSCQLVSGNSCPTPVQSELENHLHQNTLLLDLNDIKQKITGAYPDVSQVDIDITYPSKLHLTLHTKSPHAAVKTSPSSDALIIATDNTITGVGQLANPDFPVIIYSEAYRLNISQHITDPTLLFTLNVAWQLKEGFVPYSQITIQDAETIIADLADGKTAVFSSAIDSTRQVNSLQLILSKATMNQGLPVIDLRFNQPVLKRQL